MDLYILLYNEKTRDRRDMKNRIEFIISVHVIFFLKIYTVCMKSSISRAGYQEMNKTITSHEKVFPC